MAFIVLSVEKSGMTGLLPNFLGAIFSSASSFIMLNGKPTSTFALKRSVWQGCVLSPFLFILAFDVLSALLQQALDTKAIERVKFPQAKYIQALHNLFVDDGSAVITTILRYILEFHRILMNFGEALGLRCDWEQTVGSFISA